MQSSRLASQTSTIWNCPFATCAVAVNRHGECLPPGRTSVTLYPGTLKALGEAANLVLVPPPT